MKFKVIFIARCNSGFFEGLIYSFEREDDAMNYCIKENNDGGDYSWHSVTHYYH